MEKANLKYTVNDILTKLKNKANPDNLEGMARYGISTENRLGNSIPFLRELAKETGKNHELSLKLWEKGIDETKILASMIGEEDKLTEKQAEKWAAGFNSWDVCDQVCMNLFKKLPFVEKKIKEWSKREETFVKRAAFSLIACIAVYDKIKPDKEFLKFLPLIKRAASDERNYVKKAVSWALRNIGKRNKNLNKEAIKFAKELEKSNFKSAKWIARDTISDIQREKIKKK
ncbi:DNA alkylation repair protein [candidate division WOR-3 bacterium]|nr:DNA alkylation repair protein [candidate division WOR-3 bacterium]